MSGDIDDVLEDEPPSAPPPPPAPRKTARVTRRLRRQARPHYMLAGLVLAAAAGNAAATLTGEAALVAATVAAVALVTTLVAAMVLKKRRRIPARRAWTWTSAIGACVWLTVTAAAGVSWDAIAVLTVIGYGLALPYWRDNRIPDPPAPRPPSDPAPTPPPPPPLSEYVRRWRTSVGGNSGGSLPGSYLTDREETDAGERFTLQLVPGKQSLATAIAALSLIASGLRVAPDAVIVEGHTSRDNSRAQVTVVTKSPVADIVHFPGPAFDPATGIVHLGPFIDGEGLAPWRVYTENSMWGGCLIGGTGSGKSRTIDDIAVSVMAAEHTVVWYGDPDEGASSAALAEHADWTARGVPAIKKMLKAAAEIMAFRRAENAVDGAEGFTPSPERPGLLIIIDEAHSAFADPEIQAIAAEIARRGRKVGIALITASQVATLDAWGGAGGVADVLRSSVLTGNAVVFHTRSNNTKNVMAGLTVDPRDLPSIPGYAYVQATTPTGRTAPFRSYYIADAKEVYAGITPVTLDAGAATVAGEPYLNRRAEDARSRAELIAYVEAIRAGKPTTRATPAVPTRSPGTALILPFAPLVPGFADGAPSPGPIALRRAHRRVLELLAEGHSTPALLREQTGWGETHVRNTLNDLVSAGVLRRDARGRYSHTKNLRSEPIAA